MYHPRTRTPTATATATAAPIPKEEGLIDTDMEEPAPLIPTGPKAWKGHGGKRSVGGTRRETVNAPPRGRGKGKEKEKEEAEKEENARMKFADQRGRRGRILYFYLSDKAGMGLRARRE